MVQPSQPVQFCVRCNAQWLVRQAPLQWCPRCRGVLLAPARPSDPAERRGWRWAARLPRNGHRTVRTPHVPGPTPHYREVPRWGLLDPPPRAVVEHRPWLERFGARAPLLLLLTAVAFVLASGAEWVRYAVILYNRTRLVDPLLLRGSDIAVWVFGLGAPLLALAAGLAAVGWLVDRRRAGYAARAASDPRPRWAIVAGSVVPLVNLVAPGVFLAELTADAQPRVKRLVRLWWIAWVAGAVLVVSAWAWRRYATVTDSLQRLADGVEFTALVDLFAAGVALLTIWVMREIDGRDILGRTRLPKRWLAATGPAQPVIAPVSKVPAK